MAFDIRFLSQIRLFRTLGLCGGGAVWRRHFCHPISYIATTMGKKAKTKKGEQRAQERKVDKSEIPPPPPPLEEEVSIEKQLKSPYHKGKTLTRSLPHTDWILPIAVRAEKSWIQIQSFRWRWL